MICYRFMPGQFIAYSLSLFWFKRITVGWSYGALPLGQRMAVLAHEQYHVNHHHTEIRLLTALLFFPILGYICRRQEYRADCHAANLGHGHYLIELLGSDPRSSWFYPSNQQRVIKLDAYLRMIPVKDRIARIGVTD